MMLRIVESSHFTAYNAGEFGLGDGAMVISQEPGCAAILPRVAGYSPVAWEAFLGRR